ncbi:MAG: ribonuclease P protein component [Elusimicrobiota bacterium]
MSTGRFNFTKDERLHLNKDFQRVFKEGRAKHSGAMVLYSRSRHSDRLNRSLPRVGIIVSRKTAGAVQRNKLKRRLREIFRLNKNKLKPDIDMVIIGKKEAANMDYTELEKTLLNLWRKAGILRKVPIA